MKSEAIRTFELLATEAAPAAKRPEVSFPVDLADRRMVELRARYQRAEIVSEFLVDGLLWIGRGVKALAKGFAARARLVAAERQLEALDDRMLADLGVKRGDIPFAVRRAPQGVAPEFGGVAHVVPAANLDMHRAA